VTDISSTGDRMLSALETVAAWGPLSAAEVARRNGINRTVAHRLLTTLHRRSYVRRVEGGYVVGPAITRLAGSVEPELVGALLPEVAALAEETGETAVAHVIDGNDATVVAEAIGTRHLVRVQHEEGSRHPLTLGASGRALLAFQPPEKIDAIAAGAANPVALQRQLEAVRALGYAVSHNELQAGAHGVSAPVRDRAGIARASVALVVPTGRADALNEHLELLLAAAGRIERVLFGDLAAVTPS
jgi:DNA-binding IclR family transcriptional regulator